jgi:acetyl esterase/lipase
MVRILLLACGFACVCAAETKLPARGEEIALWDGAAPNAEAAPDVFERAAGAALPKRFTVVHHPSIYAFPAPKLKNTGMAIVVAPGGGHSQLVIDKEGWEVADWLNKNGISAFVLKYRLARAPGSHYTVAGDALADTNRAMSLVRSHAADWDINPERIGVMGFSAGGELAVLMETRFDKASRPDFAAVVYPGFRPGAITVPKDAPPTFLVCADDDPSRVVTTVNLYLDLQKQGVSSEMHIYATGKHGFGLRAPQALPVATWPDRMKEWMVDRKLLK